MVITPVETTLEIAAPDSVPKSAEEATEACAAPPVSPPVSRLAIFIRRSPAPLAISTAPKTMKISTLPVTTWIGWPNMPPVWAQNCRIICRRFWLNVASDPARMPVQSGSQPLTKK